MVLLAAFALALHLALPDADRTRDLAWTVQSSVAALAIAVGGVFAGYKWQVFRDFAPHLTVSHKVSHRPVGDSYIHLHVTAILHNSSKVKLEFLKSFFLLQQVAPVSDREVESRYKQVFVDNEYRDLPWPTLDWVERTWQKGELIVEPGESHQEPAEFILSSNVKSVIIYTYFYNPNGPRSSQAPGWGINTVYDIVDIP